MSRAGSVIFVQFLINVSSFLSSPDRTLLSPHRAFLLPDWALTLRATMPEKHKRSFRTGSTTSVLSHVPATHPADGDGTYTRHIQLMSTSAFLSDRNDQHHIHGALVDSNHL